MLRLETVSYSHPRKFRKTPAPADCDITKNVITSKILTFCIIVGEADCFDTSKMTFGHTIRQLRERRGWAQEELAHRVGTSAANLSRIETGKHGASETLKTLLAREFEMRVSELVALSEGATAARQARRSEKDDREEQRLLGIYRTLSSDRKTILVSIAKLLNRF